MTYRLAELTTVQAAAAADRDGVLLIPAGAFEQHGPGLPLATDLLRAEGVADLVADRFDGRIVIGPSIPIGVSPHHLAFAGTVSARPATFIALLRDYLESLHPYGFRRFLVITGHAGNNAALEVLAQDLLRELPEVEFAWTPITTLAADVVGELNVGEVHGHSGEAETAQLLHLRPDLVRTGQLRPGTTELDQLEPLPRLSRAGLPKLAVGYHRLSPDGVLGDPRRATAAAGKLIIDRATTRIVDFIKEWLDT